MCLFVSQANAQEIFNNVLRVFEIAYGGHKGKRLELQTEFFRKAEELETTFAESLANKALEVRLFVLVHLVGTDY